MFDYLKPSETTLKFWKRKYKYRMTVVYTIGLHFTIASEYFARTHCDFRTKAT